MKPKNKSCKPGSSDYLMVSAAAGELGNQACILGVRYIKNGTLRLQFNHEISYYTKSILNDVSQRKKSPSDGLKEIKDEQKSLLSQSLEVAQKGIGVIAGAFQIAAGAGICYGSVGTLCLFVGAPLMAHGSNNIYENGRNLLENRSDTQGPVRKAYQGLLGNTLEGDMAYGAVDLGLSAYGVSRMVLKPDTWRLFRYINTDYIRAYKTMGTRALVFEGISDSVTGRSMYLEYKSNGK